MTIILFVFGNSIIETKNFKPDSLKEKYSWKLGSEVEQRLKKCQRIPKIK